MKHQHESDEEDEELKVIDLEIIRQEMLYKEDSV